MTLNTGMMSSNRTDWETPPDFFKGLDQEFHFTLDVCATRKNAKCKHYYSPKVDGLKQDWEGVCWLNPPYGKSIGEWVRKAYLEARKEGVVVVGLLPARTDTAYFHDYIYGKAEIRFIRGRLKFVGAKNSAPFPSMVVIWRKNVKSKIRKG